jgi:hypothetical protein
LCRAGIQELRELGMKCRRPRGQHLELLGVLTKARRNGRRDLISARGQLELKPPRRPR